MCYIRIVNTGVIAILVCEVPKAKAEHTGKTTSLERPIQQGVFWTDFFHSCLCDLDAAVFLIVFHAQSSDVKPVDDCALI